MDDETLSLLAKSLRRVLTEASSQQLGERLAELGWDAAVAADAPNALRTLFEIKGEVLSSDDALGPRLAAVMADSLGTELVGAVVVLPASLHPDALPVFDEHSVPISGLALGTCADGARVVVPVRDHSGGTRVAVVARDRFELRIVDAIDPDLELTKIEGVVGAADAEWWTGDRAEAAWVAAIAAGRWAVAAELVGLARHVIAGAVGYAGEREQYGRAIGTFQAVQHRLASAHASVIGASAVVVEAASSVSPWVARVAKALAGRAAEDACTQAQQVYGAIGFTWEHELHRYLRRAYVLDRILGDWRTLEFEIGTELQARLDVPRIGAL